MTCYDNIIFYYFTYYPRNGHKFINNTIFYPQKNSFFKSVFTYCYKENL